MKVSEIFQIDNTVGRKKIGPTYSIGFFLIFLHKVHFTMGDRIFAL